MTKDAAQRSRSALLKAVSMSNGPSAFLRAMSLSNGRWTFYEAVNNYFLLIQNSRAGEKGWGK
jgi:hypothetical protein